MSLLQTANHSLILTVTAAAILVASSNASGNDNGLTLYVSGDGNDAWSGRLPAPKGDDGPFATLTGARDELGKIRAGGQLQSPATVFIRGGTYLLDDTFTLDGEDSGTESCPVVYRSYPGESVRLVGAMRVSGFQHYEGEILRADLQGTELDGEAFSQLFFNGQRQILARYPNVDPDDPHFGEWAHIRAVDGSNVKDRFTYTPDVYKDWTNLQYARVGIHPGYDWAWNIVPIDSVLPEQDKIILGRNVSYNLRVGDRYFVENLFEELDSPGEWYLDRDEALLYFWPPGPIEGAEVLAPILNTVVKMEGAAHVTVAGVTVEACDANAVEITDCHHCRIAGSVIRNCGAWGVRISGGSHSGAFGNDIHDIGHGGISVDGGSRETLEPGQNFATNNYIHHVAQIWHTYRPGVHIRGVGNTADHNLIHDTYHAGITLSGNENVVEFNRVHHTNLGSADTGGIYFCSRDWTQRGNVIRHNIWHHIGGFGKANSWQPVRNGKVWFEYPHFTWGIYLDDPTSGTMVYGNILWSVPICGLHNHGGRDNTFRNNIIIDCPAFRAGQLSANWSNWPAIKDKLKAVQYDGSPYLELYPDLADYPIQRPEKMTGIKFLNNIIYYTEAGTKWMREQHEDSWDGAQELYSLRVSKQDFNENVWRNNCIYAPDEIELRIRLQRMPDIDDYLSWAEWRDLGMDDGSVLADPKFVDFDNRDFRLQPESPALDRGFQQIPVAEIGPFADELRASWPIEQAPGVARLGTFTTQRYFQLPGYEPEPARELALRGGAPNFFAKVKADDPVSIAYFGGGIHPAGAWRRQVIQWLREQYPGADISTTDASICDCVRGSGFSVYRFEHDVLQKDPDLVLIDFASDDHRTDVLRIWKAVEGIIRQAWRHDPTIDLLFLYAFRSGFESAYADDECPPTVSAYEKLAEHYSIPAINMGYRIAQMAKREELVIEASADETGDTPGTKVFSRDGVRPTADANEIYAKVIAEGLRGLGELARPRPHELKPPFRKDNLQRATLVPITADMLQGQWERVAPDDIGGRNFSRHFEDVWVTETPGARLTFTFRGPSATVFDLMGPDTGRVAVTTDGKDEGTRQQVDKWCYYQRLAALHLATGLPDQEHTVTVELLPEPPNRSEPIAEATRLDRYDAAAFEGVALRFGWLRIVGELVED